MNLNEDDHDEKKSDCGRSGTSERRVAECSGQYCRSAADTDRKGQGMLYFVEGYSQDEIAEMKGVSQNTVSKKLRRIKKQLTEMCRKAE